MALRQTDDFRVDVKIKLRMGAKVSEDFKQAFYRQLELDPRKVAK